MAIKLNKSIFLLLSFDKIGDELIVFYNWFKFKWKKLALLDWPNHGFLPAWQELWANML